MLIQISPSGSTPAKPLTGWPLLRLGFRPFYFVAAVFACLSIPFWIALFLGQVNVTMRVAPLLWHAHEMLFGFAVAVIVGFLMTAGKAWTGLATPRGASLAALAALWIAARLTALVGPYALYAVLDMMLLPIVAGILLNILLRSKNRRNLPLVLILALLALANLLFHLSASSVIAVPPMKALHAGLALVVMIECVMAGRVVPAFTAAVTPGLKISMHPRVEQVTLGLTGLALALWVFATPGPITVVSFSVAAGLHLYRQAQWHPWGTRSRPILWILHVSYAWIAVGFALLALAQAGLVNQSAGVHALAIGLTGGLSIGMITRTARGHTGRTLRSSTSEVVAYSLVSLAALVRVFVPLAAPDWYVPALIVAALAWCVAFALYLYLYTPWLFSTRLDGKDG